MNRDGTRFSRRYEDYAYVLDYLPHGKPGIIPMTYRAEPLVQIVGETYFTLLEATVNKEVSVESHERVYVGKSSFRDKVNRVINRISYGDLTSTAKSELPPIIEKIVEEKEKKFVEILNQARPLTPRMHSLELLPGIGKKYMFAILRQREIKLFSSFDDLRKRAEIPDPLKLITKRILEELIEDSKYRLFTRPLYVER